MAPAGVLIPLVSGTSLLFLALLGGLAARAGGAAVMLGAMRVTFWGALAMALTAGVGSLFGTDGWPGPIGCWRSDFTGLLLLLVIRFRLALSLSFCPSFLGSPLEFLGLQTIFPSPICILFSWPNFWQVQRTGRPHCDHRRSFFKQRQLPRTWVWMIFLATFVSQAIRFVCLRQSRWPPALYKPWRKKRCSKCFAKRIRRQIPWWPICCLASRTIGITWRNRWLPLQKNAWRAHFCN